MSPHKTYAVLACLIVFPLVKSTIFIPEEYERMEMFDVILKWGYNASSYKVITEDGYILKMFRVFNNTALNKDLQPIIFFHGLTGCSNNWFLRGTESLPFLLADMGYDCWFPNSRSTFYSKKHIKYSPDEHRFWNFSWHEIGVYDMPASMDVVFNETNHEQGIVIAHSEGTTFFMVMASERPEYDAKVSLSFQLAPSVFYRYTNLNIIRNFSVHHRLINDIVESVQLHAATFDGLAKTLPSLCHSIMFGPICHEFLAVFLHNPEQLDPRVLPFLFSKVPCGGSAKEGLHYLQGMYTGGFDHYDFGPRKNLKKYGSTKPPSYKLENIKSKMIIIYSHNDYLVHVGDVMVLASKLNCVIHMEEIKDPNWSHVDYLIGKDVYVNIYSRMIKLMKQFFRQKNNNRLGNKKH